jgi:NTP pyrophosphatase (non-canonical NTP hydrolase)
LDDARERALAVRALYETLEERFNGRTWTLHELMLGFSNDVGYIGRLLLANEGTWAIAGDAEAELKHKLSESMWWLFVLADKLEIDLDEAFATTMRTITDDLEQTLARTAPAAP